VQGPTPTRERAPFIDAVRGFALFGVLVVNLALFAGIYRAPAVAAAPAEAAASAAAGGAAAAQGPAAAIDLPEALVHLFMEGRFVSLFSFLFGLGFALVLERASTGRWLRRVGVLAGIGLLHMLLVWAGDILTAYAVVGAVLVVAQRASDRALLVAAALLVAGVGLGAIARLFAEPANLGAVNWAVVTAPTYAEAWRANLALAVRYDLSAPTVGFLCAVAGKMLLGYVAGRRRLLHDPGRHEPFFRRLLVGGLLVAVAANVAVHAFGTLGWPDWRQVPYAVVAELAAVATAAVYLATFALLFRWAWFRQLVRPLEAVGRTALTCYLTQSVVSVAVFYHWPGLTAWAGSVGRARTLAFALALFTVQAVVASVWLRFFRFGPVEWLWRSLTYGRWQAMR
jgi:uncharacterized protein